MRTPWHALISLGYAFSVAAAAGTGYDDWRLYVSAVAGGCLIDLDHVFFHTVYRRDHPVAQETRNLIRQGKWRDALRYLNTVEDRREIYGLLAHNVYAQAGLAVVALILALLGGLPAYLLVALGAVLLHMICDQVGDFLTVRHIGNWLQVLGARRLERMRDLGSRLVYCVMAYDVFVVGSLVALSLSAAWQLARPQSVAGLIPRLVVLPLGQWVTSLPLLVLGGIFAFLICLSAASAYKYRRDGGRWPSCRPESSLRVLGRFLFGDKHGQLDLNQVLLSIQADQVLWAGVASVAIAIGLGVLDAVGVGQDFYFFLLPVVIAILFGSLVHTGAGEVGGVLGVLLGCLLHIVLVRLGLVSPWGPSRVFVLGISATVAWALGLVGGIVAHGVRRMSLVSFVLEYNLTGKSQYLDDLAELDRVIQEGIEEGYSRAHQRVFPASPARSRYLERPVSGSLLLMPYVGKPLLGSRVLHYAAGDRYVPFLREAAYVFLGNEILDAGFHSGRPSWLPVLPRTRCPGGPGQVDAEWSVDGSYRWRDQIWDVFRSACRAVSPERSPGVQVGLVKPPSQFLDHAMTRGETIRTDVLVRLRMSRRRRQLVVYGLAREYTTTKEVATLEAEFYASEVCQAIREALSRLEHLDPEPVAVARLYFPAVSIYDVLLNKPVREAATLLPYCATVRYRDVADIQWAMAQLPRQKFVTSAANGLKTQLLVGAFELMIAFLAKILFG